MSTRTQARAKRRAAGLCTTCGVPVTDGYATCKECRAKEREKYYRRQNTGCCGRCGKPLPEDYYYAACESCRAYIIGRYYARKENKSETEASE